MALIHNPINSFLMVGSFTRALAFDMSNSSNINAIIPNAATINIQVSVYTGPQPTANDFAKDWATMYRSPNPALLAHFTGGAITQRNIYASMNVFPPLTTPLRSGLALWAVIWGDTNVSTNLASLTIPGNRYLVVPVSNSLGNGVVRFDNPNLVTTTPVTISDVSIAMTL